MRISNSMGRARSLYLHLTVFRAEIWAYTGTCTLGRGPSRRLPQKRQVILPGKCVISASEANGIELHSRKRCIALPPPSLPPSLPPPPTTSETQKAGRNAARGGNRFHKTVGYKERERGRAVLQSLVPRSFCEYREVYIQIPQFKRAG